MKKLVVLLILMLEILLVGCKFTETGANQPPKANTQKGVIMEISPEGKEVWKSFEYKAPTCYNQDKNGNKLIADLGTSSFYSTDKKNNPVWVFAGNNPEYIEKTPEGNYLVVNQSGEKSVLEVDSTGDVIWELTNLANPAKAHKLSNGNYLLDLRQESAIKEVRKDKQPVWQTKNGLLKQPYSVQLLPNGNYLISDFDNHRIVEIDKNSQIKWVFNKGLNHPIAVRKMENGNYVISDNDNSRVIIISSAGETIKEIPNVKIKCITTLPNGNFGLAGIVTK